jgi:hypothetical protein
MAKYPLTELGYVAREFISLHSMTFIQLGENVTKATGTDIIESSFQQARRDDRGYESLRKTIMDYMREQSPDLVETATATFKAHYQKEGA